MIGHSAEPAAPAARATGSARNAASSAQAIRTARPAQGTQAAKATPAVKATQAAKATLAVKATEAAHPIDPADLIAGLGRGFAIVESFDDMHWRMTIAEVAARTAIPRSATRRYLLSLCHFGYADTDGRHYWLTPRVMRLGQGYLESVRLPRLVRPFIEQLSTAIGETVNASVLDGHDVVYVARSHTPRLVSIGFQVGERAPAHVVSPGIVLLSMLPDPALRSWVAHHDFGSYTPATVTRPAAFLANVRKARRQDWWMADGLLDAGLTGIAVPLRDRRGRSVAALGTTVQRVHWDHARIVAQLLPGLRETAQSLRGVV